MKAIGATLIVLSAAVVVGVMLYAFMPRYLIPGPTSQIMITPTPRPANNYNLPPEIMESTQAGLTTLYMLPIVIMLATFVQVLGWGLLLAGMINDNAPVTAKRLGL